MKKTIEKIEEFILKEFEKNKNHIGFTATEIANELGIQRNNASTELNKLHKSGILEKTQTRPVRYSPSKLLLISYEKNE